MEKVQINNAMSDFHKSPDHPRKSNPLPITSWITLDGTCSNCGLKLQNPGPSYKYLITQVESLSNYKLAAEKQWLDMNFTICEALKQNHVNALGVGEAVKALAYIMERERDALLANVAGMALDKLSTLKSLQPKQ